MKATFCPFEEELVDALARGFLNGQLEAHVRGCESCGELQIVATAFLDESRTASSEAAVPGSGTMWWRMQIRRRQEAQAAARSSLLAVQAVTLAAAIVVVIALFGGDVLAGIRGVVLSIRFSTPILLAVATWLLLAPIAGWMAIRQK